VPVVFVIVLFYFPRFEARLANGADHVGHCLSVTVRPPHDGLILFQINRRASHARHALNGFGYMSRAIAARHAGHF
jgi:hypothetical protein